MTVSAVNLDQRRRQVLAAAVKHYVDTAEPVGSHAIAAALGFRISSATIRHDFTALEHAGYLHQPHTSAGRVPTDLGYRFYVNELMRPYPPGLKTQHLVVELYREQTEFDPALEATCRLLTSLTHYPALAAGPSWRNSLLRRIELTRINRTHVLAVIITQSGQIRHSLLAITVVPSNDKLHQIADLLTHKFAGRRLGDLTRESLLAALGILPGGQKLREQAVELVIRSLGEREQSLAYVQGTALIFEQREFRHPERAQPLLQLLQDQTALIHLLQFEPASLKRSSPASAQTPSLVTVKIGKENEREELQECALICASYQVADRLAGSVAILGPKRLPYERAVPTVHWVARRLGEALTRISQ